MLAFINISARRDIGSLLEGVLLETLCRVHFQNDGRTHHFNLKVQTYFDRRFPGHGGPQDWSPGSPDLNSLYRVATKYSLHFKYTKNTEYTRYRELVCFTWKSNSSSSIHPCVSAICNSQNVQTVLNFTPCVFSVGMSQKRLHYSFVNEIQPHYQLLDGISGPIRSPKRRNPLGLYRGSERPRDWSVPPNPSVSKVFIERLSHCNDHHHVWLKVYHLRDWK
jgi:hypothetical protein